ncbi:MAG: hypothetical protein J7K75_07105 [Desulfuromonas sp.]|nr:hypothetical protein [Desulfuromonas sp.]
MKSKYQQIRRTPTFIKEYSRLRSYLDQSSPLAFQALSQAMTTILETIDAHPRSWPRQRRQIGGNEFEFHLAVMSIAYRHLHLRYFVDDSGICYLAAIWVDGHDEPKYSIN